MLHPHTRRAFSACNTVSDGYCLDPAREGQVRTVSKLLLIFVGYTNLDAHLPTVEGMAGYEWDGPVEVAAHHTWADAGTIRPDPGATVIVYSTPQAGSPTTSLLGCETRFGHPPLGPEQLRSPMGVVDWLELPDRGAPADPALAELLQPDPPPADTARPRPGGPARRRWWMLAPVSAAAVAVVFGAWVWAHPFGGSLQAAPTGTASVVPVPTPPATPATTPTQAPATTPSAAPTPHSSRTATAPPATPAAISTSVVTVTQTTVVSTASNPATQPATTAPPVTVTTTKQAPKTSPDPAPPPKPEPKPDPDPPPKTTTKTKPASSCGTSAAASAVNTHRAKTGAHCLSDSTQLAAASNSCAQTNAAGTPSADPCAGTQLVYLGATDSFPAAVEQLAARGGATILGSDKYLLAGGGTARAEDGRWVVVISLG